MSSVELSFLSTDFEVLDKLGMGGMGQVFKARQKSLDRLVAIKILPKELCRNAEFIGRFKREARLAGKFYHPNAVQVYDIGEHKGQYYYIMEYVTGGSLKEKLQKLGRLEESYVINVMRQILQVLKEAENLKIIHRDIKPDNIMLTGDGTVKLADLGLAREVDDDAGLTQQKIAIGTPHYMAPEQAQGKPVDMRADQYALGVTSFHLMTGQPPFTGKNNMEVLVQHVKKNMPKPSSVYPPISPLMDKLILKMTAKDPGKRFQRISDLLQALDKVELQLRGHEHKPLGLRELKVKTERVSTVYKRREKNSSAGLMILIVILLAAVVGYFVLKTDTFSPTNGGGTFARDKERIIQYKEQGLYEKALAEINQGLEKCEESERINYLSLRVQIQKLASLKQVEAILAISYDTIESCEKAIKKLDALVLKYADNAEGVVAAKFSLKKKIQAFKLIENERVDLEKEKAKEERVSKLSVEITDLAKQNKYKEAIEKIEAWVKDNSDTTGKVRGLSDDIIDLEDEYFKIVKSNFDSLFTAKKFDEAIESLSTFIEHGYQKSKVEEFLKLVEKCKTEKKNHQLEIAKKKHKAYMSIRDDVLNLLKINEPEAAEIKLSQTKYLDAQDAKFFKKIIDDYRSVSVEIANALNGHLKDQILLNKIGNKKIEVRIKKIEGGVIYYNFEGSALELDQLADDWAISMADVANYVVPRKKAEDLLRLCIFSYANGAYDIAIKLYNESKTKGLEQSDEIKNIFNYINDDYLDYVDYKFDEYFENINAALDSGNMEKARAVLNELKKKYGQTAIFSERQKEVEHYQSKIKE